MQNAQRVDHMMCRAPTGHDLRVHPSLAWPTAEPGLLLDLSRSFCEFFGASALHFGPNQDVFSI